MSRTCDWCPKEAEFVEVTGDPYCERVHACAQCFDRWTDGLDPADFQDRMEGEVA